jgi:type IV pilus assembly protein PilM
MLTTIWSKLWRKSMLLAIDISIDGIYLLSLQAQQQSWLINRCIKQPLHDGIIEQSTIVDWSKLQAQLTNLITQAKLHNYPVALALPNNIIMRKNIQLPAYLHNDELYENIKLDLLEYFPEIDTDNVYFDFVIETTTNSMHEILLVAIAQHKCQQLCSTIANAGLQLKILDIDIYAYTRASTWYLRQTNSKAKAGAIIVIHDTTANFIILQPDTGKCLFAYSWSLVSPNNLLTDTQQAWRLAQTALPTVRLEFIGITANWQNLAQLANELQLAFAVPTKIITILTNLRHTDQVSTNWLTECSSQILLCFGLAIRALDS